MEDSWCMPRRRSTEQTHTYPKHQHHSYQKPSEARNHNTEDFSDVFGGPPRTLHLTRNFSGNNLFQENIFKTAAHSMFSTRSSGGDIFDEEDDVRSRTRSQSMSTKSKSKSSSNELSPGRWSPKPMNRRMQHFPFEGNGYLGKQCKKRNSDDANARRMLMMMRMSSNNFGFSRRVLSPERDVEEFDSFEILKQVVEDYEISSPPSSPAKSSVCQEEEVVVKSRNDDCSIPDNVMEDYEEDDDDDIMSSYVIEINDFNRFDPREETAEAVGVDDAIAWAKEKYQSWIQREKDQSLNLPGLEESAGSQTQMDEDSASSSLGNDSILSTTENGTIETQKDEEQKAMELLDEGIKLWSAYKETNIQLLLSTLHHILWSSSGWTVVSLADIIDSSQVKKAYQKARLCLHPDKLQQRGATPLQKYVAAEAFSILQAAWETFISRKL